MGKIILGTNEVNKIYLGEQEVSKVYLGDVEVWSASSLPDWIPNQEQLIPLIDALPKVSEYYIDFAYNVNNPVINFEYYRVYTNTLTPCELTSNSNQYSVFQVPYNSNYRGFNVYKLFKPTDSRPWYNTGQGSEDRNADRGRTGWSNATYYHRAIIQSTVPQFTNNTGVPFEDYR